MPTLYVAMEDALLVAAGEPATGASASDCPTAGSSVSRRRPSARSGSSSGPSSPVSTAARTAARPGGTPRDGLDHRYCWSVVADPADPNRLVLSAASGPRAAHSTGTAESHVYRRDGRKPWERVESDVLPTGEGVLRAVLATTVDSGVYAANNRGLYRSDDAGESWTGLEVPWPDRFHEQTVRGLAVV